MTVRPLLLSTAGLADLSLVVLFFLVRTDAPLHSPWQLLSPWVFVVFGLSTAALWLAAGEKQDGWLIFGMCMHGFTATSLSAFVYVLGFGFDPLLHQAAEIAWQQHGPILPFSILYSGQYALVSGIASLSRLSVFTVDRWLVPLLATITPLIAATGLRMAWGVPRHMAPRAAFALFLVPFAPLTFTIPYHLGVVLLIWILCWLPTRNARVRIVLILLSGLALLTHPLIGIPAVVLVAASFAMNCLHRPWAFRFFLAAVFAVSASALPAAFLWLYRHQQTSAVDWNGIFHPAVWFGLFLDPYPFVGWGWEVLYLFRQTLPLLFSLVASVTAWRAFPEQRRAVGTVLCFLFGLLSSTFLLTSLFRHPDVISFEQYEFPLRLIQLLTLVAFPLLALTTARLAGNTSRAWITTCVCLGVAVLSSIAWFFSYPQMNIKAYWSGASASAQDAAIVRQIETHASGTPHIVLSQPVTAALAVRTYGFRQVPGGMLWYPLPTGGVLFPYFLQLSQAPDPIVAAEAADVSGVHRVYVVHDASVSSTPSALRIEPYGILVDIYDTP